jgi:hypothetical protein
MLYSTVTIEPSKTGLYSATIQAGPQTVTLYGYLFASMAKVAAASLSRSAFGRVPRFVEVRHAS